MAPSPRHRLLFSVFLLLFIFLFASLFGVVHQRKKLIELRLCDAKCVIVNDQLPDSVYFKVSSNVDLSFASSIVVITNNEIEKSVLFNISDWVTNCSEKSKSCIVRITSDTNKIDASYLKFLMSTQSGYAVGEKKRLIEWIFSRKT